VRRAGALAIGALTLSGCATVTLGVHQPFSDRFLADRRAGKPIHR